MKILISLSVVLAVTALYADEILLKNGKVIHGDVKGAGSDKIFYLEEATPVTKELPRADAERITYSDGLIVNPHETSFDEIVKKDGSFARAKVLRITEDTVIAHGPRQVIPMRLPVDELSKIVYSDGRTILFQGPARNTPGTRPEDKTRSEGRQQAEQAYPPPTHHIDGDMNLFIIALAGLGITRNGDLCSYTNQQAERYLDHLQAYYTYWDNNSVDSSNNPYYPDLDLEIEGRVFGDIGIGLGMTAGFSILLNDTVSIINPDGVSTADVDSTVIFSYLSTTLYLKNYYATRNSMAFYWMAGAGIGYYWANVMIDITPGTNGSYGTPEKEQFEGDFSGTAVGYHAVLETGIEQRPVTLMAGVKFRHAEVDELKSGSSVMRLESGRNATVKLNGFMIYAGIGMFM